MSRTKKKSDGFVPVAPDSLQNLADRKSLGQLVFENLKQAIIMGEIPPGTRLVESQVAEAHDISRTPVREAIHKLERERFVGRLPRGGFTVLGLSREDIIETFGIRSVLEGYAARLAAVNHQPADLTPLQEKIDEFQRLLDRRQLKELTGVNTKFHALLYTLSKSPRLVHMIHALQDQIFRFRQIILRDAAAGADQQRRPPADADLYPEKGCRGRRAAGARAHPQGPGYRPRPFQGKTPSMKETHGMPLKKIKILVGKPGLDGHDRGAKVIALALRDAGMEVVYTGLHKTLEQIVRTAVQEGVDVIGLSIMSGAHLPICRKLIEMLKAEGVADVPVVVGGVIPKPDVAKLKELGVKGVFPGGASFAEIVSGIQDLASKAA